MDHCRAVDKIFHDGQAGESYNVGSHEEHSNLDMMRIVCRLLDRLEPWNGHSYEELIKTSPIAPVTISAMPLTQAKSAVSSAGTPKCHLKPASNKRYSGI